MISRLMKKSACQKVYECQIKKWRKWLPHKMVLGRGSFFLANFRLASKNDCFETIFSVKSIK